MRSALNVATRKPGPPAPGVTILAGKIRAGLDKADRLVESFLALAERRVIGRTTVASPIETRPGVGYRITDPS